jgi:hypothetical protein
MIGFNFAAYAISRSLGKGWTGLKRFSWIGSKGPRRSMLQADLGGTCPESLLEHRPGPVPFSVASGPPHPISSTLQASEESV